MIDDPETARRLARAIVQDLRLYNEPTLDAGQDLTEEVDEGRALFRGRVATPLHEVFEQVIGDPAVGGPLTGYARTATQPSAPVTPPLQGIPTGFLDPSPVPRSGNSAWVWISLLVALAVAAAWLLVR